jgi:hypothetical protein
MGATYTRQSSSAIVDGAVIEASDINAEFDQVLAAFAVTSGHTHDGTAAEGGPITKLLGTAITIGDGTAGTDIAVTFDGETADGVLTWMEDEDYFKFSDDILMNSTERLNFGDTGTYIFQSTDGQLDIVADTEVQIAATTIDINGAVDISGALTLAGTTLAETISDTVGAMVTSNTESGITVAYDDADNTLDFTVGTLNQSTTGNAATATALATARTIHGVSFDGTANIDLSEVISDTVGAMVSSNTESGITVAYDDADNTLDFTVGTLNQNTTGTAATVTTAAQPNITSLGTLTTLTVDNVIINGSTIGHTGDTDLITVASGIATVAGEVSMTTLDIGGTNVTATAAELNLIDGGATVGTTAIADGDGIIHNDGTTMRVTSAATFKTYFTAGVSSAADDLTAGDAAVLLTTSLGNITIDAAANDSDIILKGTDGTVDTTYLTIDGSAAGAAAFNSTIATTGLIIGGTALTSTATELNLLDGVSGLVQADLTKLAAIDSTAAELNLLDGLSRGSIIYGNASAATAILTKGTAGQVLTSDGTDIAWADSAGGADPSSADGDTLGTASLEWSDLFLADGGQILFGNDQDITLTHVADSGLALKSIATTDNKPVRLVLQTGETDIAASDVIGAIDFQAPDEGTGTDAVLVSASIEAVSEGDFSASANATSLVFKTGASEAAAAKLKLTSAGHLLPATDDTHDLGSASFQWRNIYTGDLHLSNESKAEGNIVDGTTGNWTIQEGSEELYILNNKSGKKYKFNLTEV